MTALLGCAFLSVQAAFAQFDAVLERDLFDSANAERTKVGLPALLWNDKLMQAARLHAEKMAAENKLSHRAEGEAELFNRVAATHLAFSAASENVASATYSEDIHPGLMRSPGHRANILRANSNALGVAVLKVNDIYYAVQNFAHITSPDSGPAAEQRFIIAFLAERRAKHRPQVPITPLSSLRAFACEMAQHDNASVKSIGMVSGFHAAVGYTTSEPEEFPGLVQSLAADVGFSAMRVGACYKATTRFPGGIYWFVIVY